MAMKKDETKLNSVEVPDWYIKLEPRIIELTNLKEKVENELGELRTTVLSMMKAEGITNVASDLTSSSLTKGTMVNKFNTEKFKKDHADLYKRYCTQHYRSESVAFKMVCGKKKEAK